MRKVFLHMFVAIALIMVSCEDKKNGNLNSDTSLEEFEKTPSWEELLADSIVEKEHVGKECAVICNNLDIATNRLSNVLSPDGLISAKKIYFAATTNLANDTQGLSSQEKSAVQNHKSRHMWIESFIAESSSMICCLLILALTAHCLFANNFAHSVCRDGTLLMIVNQITCLFIEW